MKKNSQVALRKDFQILSGLQNVILHITAQTFYRVYINGSFVYHGPCRTAHGYARVDSISISKFVKPGDNILAIEVASYCDPEKKLGYATGGKGLLLAEIDADGTILV